MTINYNVGKLGRNDKPANYIVQFDTISGIVPSNINVSNNVVNVSGSLTASSGNFNSLSVNGTGVSVSGHTHTSSDITNFNSSVSGLVSGIYAPLSGKLNQFASTSSAELFSVISDETGSGVLVFNTSPSFSGVPTVPTASSGTNTNQIASTSFVRTEISNLVASAPSTLDTLNELATALGNDANFSTTVTNSLANKANLSGATFTGSVSAPSGNFTTLRQNGTVVSVSGHSHGNITSDGKIGSVADRIITTADNGLLVANSDVQFNCSAVFIGTSGDYINNGGIVLTPQAIIFSDNTVQETAYTGKIGSTSGLLVVTTTDGLLTSSSGINSSLITDFNTAVQSASPQEVVEYLETTNFPPSGNSTLLYIATDSSRSYRWTGSQYIEVGSSASYVANHTHSASDITNFNSSVSGLLPITSILAGNNVSVAASGTSYIISSSGTGGGSSIKLGTIMALS